MDMFGEVPHFIQISAALRVISSVMLSSAFSDGLHHVSTSAAESASSTAEVKILRFQLSSLASQLKRAEKVILDSSSRTDAQDPNQALVRKVSELEVALRSMTCDRDDAMKRYLSIAASLQGMQEQLHIVALEFATLRRNEAQLCLELLAQSGVSFPQSHAAAIAGIRQRLARQRQSENCDLQREVDELLREWGQGTTDGHLARLDLEAVRSAKKRSLLKEQNEMIAQLQSEVQQLRSQLQTSKSDSNSTSEPASLSGPGLTPRGPPCEDSELQELQRRLDFCETERRSSAVLVDSLSQRLAEEENASQELKAALASSQVDCSIAQVGSFLFVKFSSVIIYT
jgi:hypothetical protein